MGGGAAYAIAENTEVKLHAGVNQPDSPLFFQSVPRPRPHAQPGAAQVSILDRQKVIGSARLRLPFSRVKKLVFGSVSKITSFPSSKVRQRKLPFSLRKTS